MPTRNVNLTDELDHFVLQKVESGRYENASEVVRAALRTLEREEQRHEAKLAALRTAIDEGDASGIAEGNALQFGHLQGCHGIAVGQYGASGGGSLNHGWVTDNVGRGALGEGFSFNLLTEQRYQILAGGTPSAKAPLR